MIVRLLFICSLSLGHSLYSVLAGGATLENLSVYSYYSVQYWCVGAALLAKRWLCGWICRGFGKCAAWVGRTFGLVLSHINVRANMNRWPSFLNEVFHYFNDVECF